MQKLINDLPIVVLTIQFIAIPVSHTPFPHLPRPLEKQIFFCQPTFALVQRQLALFHARRSCRHRRRCRRCCCCCLLPVFVAFIQAGLTVRHIVLAAPTIGLQMSK